jgi:protein-arginine deiminase
VVVACNDASDDVVNGKADAKDLARLRTVPIRDLASSATGTVTIGAGAGHIRLFLRTGHQWQVLPATPTFSAAQLETGLELGIEGTAKCFARPE